MISYLDSGLFIGLTSLPFGEENKFIDIEFRSGLFETYKKRLKEHFSNKGKDDEFEYHYQPAFYVLFGSYDLAIISLVDDFTLGSQIFRPFNSFLLAEKDEGKYAQDHRNYNYQVFSGTLPLSALSADGSFGGDQMEYDKKKERFYKKFNETIFDAHLKDKKYADRQRNAGYKDNMAVVKKERLESGEYDEKEEPKYPLMALCKLKLNNNILIGSGALLKNAVIVAVHKFINQRGEKNKIKGFLIDSFSCHEFSLLLFSEDSYVHMADLIGDLREWDMADLYSLLDENEQEEDTLTKQLKKTITESSAFSVLAKKAQEDKSESGTIYAHEASHVFVNTQTSFGYHTNYVGDIEGLKNVFSENDRAKFDHKEKHYNSKMFFRTNWEIKPGHIAYVKKLIKNKIEGDTSGQYASIPFGDIIIEAGKGVIIFPSTTYGVEHLHAPMTMINEVDGLKKHIRRIRTDIDFIYSGANEKNGEDNNELSKHLGAHLITGDLLNKEPFSFTINDIEKLRLNIHQLLIFRVLRERLLHMFVNYNNGIDDPILYGNFLELRPYLKNVIATLRTFKSELTVFSSLEAKEEANTKVHNQIEILADIFEKAFANRFRQSYRMLELTDYTLEYNGGIQQLISGLDASYKAICYYMGDNVSPTSFAYVSGFYGVDSDNYSVRLNYFHAFQLEIFAMVATHEASNPLLTNYKSKGTDVLISGYYWEKEKTEGDASEKPLFENLNGVFATILIQGICERLHEDIIEVSLTKNEKKQLPGFGDSPYQGTLAEVLKEKINYLLKNFDFTNQEQNILDCFDKELLRYIVSDLSTLALGYNFDIDQFFYFHWAYYFQLTHLYNKKGTIAKRPFVQYLLRMVIAQRLYYEHFYFIVKPEANEEDRKKELEACLNVPSPCFQLDQLWEDYYTIAHKYFENLLLGKGDLFWNEDSPALEYDANVAGDFIDRAVLLAKLLITKEISESIYIKPTIGKKKDRSLSVFIQERLGAEAKIAGWRGEDQRKEKNASDEDNKLALKKSIEFWGNTENYLSELESFDEDFVNKHVQKRHQTIEDYVKKHKENISQGRSSLPCVLLHDTENETIFIGDDWASPKNFSPSHRSLYVHSLFISYLGLIKEINQESDFLLFRSIFDEFKDPFDDSERGRANNKGRGDIIFTYKSEKSNYAPILIDPVGGVFTHQPEIRRKIYKMRSAMINNLWHFSNMTKYSLIKDCADSNVK